MKYIPERTGLNIKSVPDSPKLKIEMIKIKGIGNLE